MDDLNRVFLFIFFSFILPVSSSSSSSYFLSSSRLDGSVSKVPSLKNYLSRATWKIRLPMTTIILDNPSELQNEAKLSCPTPEEAKK